jgi:Stress responsive A/B Barrel Domain
MKKLILSIFVASISLVAFSQGTKHTELRHIVLFTFRDSATKEQVANVVKNFAGLYGKVPEVKKFEWGLNMSPEHLDQGFTHCFMLTFGSEKDLASYSQNPAHKQFQAILKPVMDKVFVVDYWVEPNP